MSEMPQTKLPEAIEQAIDELAKASDQDLLPSTAALKEAIRAALAHEHRFERLEERTYQKRSGAAKSAFNRDVEYRKLYCTACGDTIEVVAIDMRKAGER